MRPGELFHHYNWGINKNSPAVNDKRKWCMCNYCNYDSLSIHGMVIHLAKAHNIRKKKYKLRYTQDEVNDAIIQANKEVFDDIECSSIKTNQGESGCRLIDLKEYRRIRNKHLTTNSNKEKVENE